jgi:hypothetical protein
MTPPKTTFGVTARCWRHRAVPWMEACASPSRFLLGVSRRSNILLARRILPNLLVGVLLARSAGAQPASEQVAYTAVGGCPIAETFSQQIVARTPMFRERAAEHALRVQIVSDPDGGVIGHASLVLSGNVVERELRALRCEEVVEALALVVAILIDPNADTRPISEANTPPAVAPQPPVAAPPPPPTAESPPPELRQLPKREHPPVPARSGPTYRFIAGAHAAAEGAAAPELTLGPRVFFGIEVNGAWPWPSSLRLSGARLFSRRLRDDVGSAKLTLDLGRLDVCFLRLSKGRLALAPCVGADVGVLRVDGSHPRGGHDHRLVWAAAGALGRGSLSLSDRFVGEVEIGADIPLVQYRYAFEGRPPIFKSARVGMHLGVGLGVHFP